MNSIPSDADDLLTPEECLEWFGAGNGLDRKKVKTGAERYFDEQMNDPEYREAFNNAQRG